MVRRATTVVVWYESERDRRVCVHAHPWTIEGLL